MCQQPSMDSQGQKNRKHHDRYLIIFFSNGYNTAKASKLQNKNLMFMIAKLNSIKNSRIT